MAAAILVFLVVVGLSVGGFYAATMLPGVLEQRRVAKRLIDVAAPAEPDGPEPSVVRQLQSGPFPALDRALAQSPAGGWLVRLIEQSGTRSTPSGVVALSVLAAMAGAIVAMTASRFVVTIPVAAAIGASGPIVWLMRRKSTRLKRFEEQFPEALDLLSRATRAGHALQTALGMVGDELPAPVGPEFKKTFDQQNFGLPLREALDALAVRVPILDVRFFVTAVLIQRDTGGNLSEILDNLAHVVRERFKLRRQIRVHTAHGRFTAYVLLALPAALAVALTFINPEHMQLLFREHMGQMMLGGTIVLQTIGYIWIRQVIKIEV